MKRNLGLFRSKHLSKNCFGCETIDLALDRPFFLIFEEIYFRLDEYHAKTFFHVNFVEIQNCGEICFKDTRKIDRMS